MPPWWLAEVNAKFSELKAAKQITKVSLAARLSEAVGRKPAWDHKAVERFLDDDVTTVEMMFAFLRVFPSLLPPVFFAHSRSEAERMFDVLARRGETSHSTPDWRDRYIELEAKMLEAAEPVRDQIPDLPSRNAGSIKPREQGSRRPRSVDRGRP